MTNIGKAIAEIRREKQVRSHVYPKLVDQGKITQEEADRRMEALNYAQIVCEQVALRQAMPEPAQGPLGHDLSSSAN